MNNTLDYPHYPPLFLVRITEKIRFIFLRLYRRFTHPNVAVFEMLQHFWLAAGIGVAAELGIADILREGPKTVRELSEYTGSHEESLYRLMRMLASHGIFREKNDRIFTLTPLAKALREDQVKFLISSHLTKLHFNMFSEFLYCIQTGKNASALFTHHALFDHLAEDTHRNELFIKAMTNASMMQIAAIMPVISFGRFRNIVDLGGGQGLMMASILLKYKHTGGIVFDLPQMQDHTMMIIKQFQIADRCKFIAGSLFDKVPEGGDLYMLKSVLHDWDDEACLKILGNIHKVMSSGSKLMIIEPIIEKGNKPSFGKMNDMLMMVAVGGKERTKAEFASLLSKTGFIIKKTYRTVSPLNILEAEIVS